MRAPRIKTLLSLLLLCTLAGCGQKGRLYMPKPEPAAQPPAPASDDAESRDH